MVVVKKLTKYSHFILVNLTHKETNTVEIYMKDNVKLHGIPKGIISNRDSKFTSNFWKGLYNGLGANLNFITTYYHKHMGK
jgi:hypothetical protein